MPIQAIFGALCYIAYNAAMTGCENARDFSLPLGECVVIGQQSANADGVLAIRLKIASISPRRVEGWVWGCTQSASPNRSISP